MWPYCPGPEQIEEAELGWEGAAWDAFRCAVIEGFEWIPWLLPGLCIPTIVLISKEGLLERQITNFEKRSYEQRAALGC